MGTHYTLSSNLSYSAALRRNFSLAVDSHKPHSLIGPSAPM